MKKKHIVLCIVLSIILVATFTTTLVYKNIDKNLKQLSVMAIQEIDFTKLSDGVYEGSYQVFPVSVEVEVTINNHEIARIDLIKHSNGQGKPAEIITEKVIEAQSLKVDVISGATYSSKVILKAIENALIKTEN